MNKSDAQAAIKKAAQTVIAEKSQQPQAFHVQVQQQLTAGPLPPPEVLKRYGEAVPNGPERIMAMAEKEQRHLHTLQNWSVALTLVGEVFSWSLVVLAMAGAFFLVLKDKRLEGAASLFTGLALLAAGYFERHKQSRGDKKPKSGD